MTEYDANQTQSLYKEFEDTLKSLVSSPQSNQMITTSIESHFDNRSKAPSGKLIQHNLVSLLGNTTNVLVYSYFDSNIGAKLTRNEIRKAIDSHKKALEETIPGHVIARIQSGKAAVDFWIDRLVETGELHKLNSNPVVFWKNQSKNKPRDSPIPFNVQMNSEYELVA